MIEAEGYCFANPVKMLKTGNRRSKGIISVEKV